MGIIVVKANVANALSSAAKDHIIAVANDIYDEKIEKYQSAINDQFKVVTSLDDLKDDSVKGSLAVVAGEKNILYIKTDTAWEEFSSGIKIVSSFEDLDSSAPTGSVSVVAGDTSKLYVKEGDNWNPYVVDNLTTDDATKALSAAKGKELKESINTLSTNLEAAKTNLSTQISTSADNITTAYTKAIDDLTADMQVGTEADGTPKDPTIANAINYAIYGILNTPL